VFTTRFETFSRAVFVLDWVLLILVLAGSRVAFRLLGDWLRPPSTAARRTLIYGAGDGGALTLRELRNNADLARQPIGFLDDDRHKRGRRIDGLPILGGLDVAEEIFTAQRGDELAQIRARQGRLFILGVGGSAANASHAVNDFRKLCAFEAYAPTDNVSELTARTNDEGWSTVFAEWLKGSRLNPRDGVLIFSVGGGDLAKNISANLVAAVQLAKQVGVT